MSVESQAKARVALARLDSKEVRWMLDSILEELTALLWMSHRIALRPKTGQMLQLNQRTNRDQLCGR